MAEEDWNYVFQRKNVYTLRVEIFAGRNFCDCAILKQRILRNLFLRLGFKILFCGIYFCDYVLKVYFAEFISAMGKFPDFLKYCI